MEILQDFFKEETINGFKVTGMMKRAWSAQLEVLDEIKRVCQYLNIQFWADWGTMLGAVRHGGFIPWDDDIDICMMRKDYMRFLQNAPEFLDKWFELKSVYNDPTYDIVKARVINGRHINFESSFLEKFHGCPYVVGVDIFPIDNIPNDKGKMKEQVDILKLLLKIEASIPEQEPYSEDDIDLIRSMENALGINVNYQNRLRHEVKKAFDIVSSYYASENTIEVSCMLALAVRRKEYICKKKWYEKSVEMKFENTTISVPIGYKHILKLNYGEDYMVPQNIGSSHDYPFYKEQIQGLREVMEREFKQTLSDQMMEQLIEMKVAECYK